MLSTQTTSKDSLEFNLIQGSKYINKISQRIKGNLPEEVTKEELMNYYLHGMSAKGAMDTNVTIVNLIQAANMAGVKVKGSSILEINVPIMEQIKYITEDIRPREDKKLIRQKMVRNKDSIVQAYESGSTLKELASYFNINPTTMRRYLKEFGAKIRRAGVKSLKAEIICDSKMLERRKRKVCLIRQ